MENFKTRITLIGLLYCLLSVSTFGGYYNKPLRITVEKIDIDSFRLLMATSTVQYKVKTLILNFLKGKQTPSSLADLFLDIRKTVLTTEKGLIENQSIKADEKMFLEQSTVSFEVKFSVPQYKEKEAQLTFAFKVELEDE